MKLRVQHDGRPGASDRSDDLGAVDAPIRSLCRSRRGQGVMGEKGAA